MNRKTLFRASDSVRRILALREQVAALMVRVHKIEPALAAYHADAMDIVELTRRVEMYAAQGVTL